MLEGLQLWRELFDDVIRLLAWQPSPPDQVRMTLFFPPRIMWAGRITNLGIWKAPSKYLRRLRTAPGNPATFSPKKMNSPTLVTFIWTGTNLTWQPNHFKKHWAWPEKSRPVNTYNTLRVMARFSMLTGDISKAGQFAQQALEIARRDGNRCGELYPRLVQAELAVWPGESGDADTTFREIGGATNCPVFLRPKRSLWPGFGYKKCQRSRTFGAAPCTYHSFPTVQYSYSRYSLSDPESPPACCQSSHRVGRSRPYPQEDVLESRTDRR
jgi:hypothetical protein